MTTNQTEIDEIVKSKLKSSYPKLSELFLDIKGTESKMHQFTMLKCGITRDINTCAIEYIYFEAKLKEIINATLECVSNSERETEKSNNLESENECYRGAYEGSILFFKMYIFKNDIIRILKIFKLNCKNIF